jgi:hypothetical protein
LTYKIQFTEEAAMNTIFIGIAGGTGSGKTTLTEHLKQHFGDDISVVHHDSYYKHQDLPFEERCKQNYDHPDAFETDLMVKQLKELKSGKAIHCPVYSYADHQRTEETELILPSKVVIVEGILIFQDPTLREMLDIKIFVETVVLLSHKKPDSHINIKVEFGEGEGKVPLKAIAERAEAYKPKERVTYKMIKEYIEAKYGFKVHTAYIAEVKRDLGLPMYDAPNAVEELKNPRKHPTAEKVEAIKDALKYFEVI